MPSDKAALYLARLGKGARVIDHSLPSPFELHSKSTGSTRDMEQDTSSDTVQPSPLQNFPDNLHGVPAHRGSTHAGSVEIPLSAAGLVAFEGERQQSVAATDNLHGVPAHRGSTHAGSVEIPLSAAGSVSFEGERQQSVAATPGLPSSAPCNSRVGRATLAPTGIRPNVPRGLPPNSGTSPNFSGITPNLQNPPSASILAPQLIQLLHSQATHLQNRFPTQPIQYQQSVTSAPHMDAAVSYLLDLARGCDPSSIASQPQAPPQQFAGAPATITSQPPAAPPRLDTHHASAYDQPSTASGSVAASEVDSEDEDAYDRPSSSFSLSEAVSLLIQNFPDMAASEAEVDNSDLSMAAAALGMGTSTHRERRLRESNCVSTALAQALSSVRGSKGRGGVSADNVPYFPSALHCGQFLPPARLGRNRFLLERHSIPDGPMHATAQDLNLMQDRSGSHKHPPPVSLPDKTAADFEENVRRALEQVSVLDSFMAGFIRTVRNPESPPSEFQLREEIDTECLGAFAAASVSLMQRLASNLAVLHTNIRLARRDAILSSSNMNRDIRHSLRAAPPDSDGSFFGACADSSIEHEAKLARDLQFVHPQPRQPKPQFAAKGPRRDSSGPPSGRQSSFARARPKPKPKSDRFRPYPTQTSTHSSSGNKGDRRRSSHRGRHPQ